MITNLIFNAVGATPGAGVITVRTHRSESEAVIEVRARCLEPFFTTKGEAGAGLGLALPRDGNAAAEGEAPQLAGASPLR